MVEIDKYIDTPNKSDIWFGWKRVSTSIAELQQEVTELGFELGFISDEYSQRMKPRISKVFEIIAKLDLAELELAKSMVFLNRAKLTFRNKQMVAELDDNKPMEALFG